MKKVELALPVAEWATLKSKYAPDIKQVLADEFTRGTINIDTQTKGAITKRKGSITYNPTALANPIKDQYEAIFSDGVRHTLAVQSGEVKYTSGDRVFNTVVNGTGFAAEANFEFELAQDRVYGGNGANDPITYDRTTNYGGVVYSAPQIKPMGAIAPITAPTTAVVAGGSVPVGPHTYKVTFLYYDFEESNGGPASGVATTTGGNQTVNLSAVPVGGYGVTARKIYRDNNDGVYVLVGTISNNTSTTFSDTVAAGTTPIPTDNGLPPTFGQIVLFLDSLFVADVPGQPSIIYYSQSGLPDIFAEGNTITCNQKDPITALIVYQDRIIVFNRRSMGQILGRTPDQYRYSHIPGSVGCVDNRTIQTRTIDGVPVLVWLSDKGFYMYNGNSITYISEDIEDQVNVNIQQANYQKGSHTDDSQQDFEDGSYTPGIDLDSIPGSITTPNPVRTFDDQADWEGGSVKSNIVTKNSNNTIKLPTRFAPAFADGNISGLLNNGANTTIQTISDFTGQDNITGTSSSLPGSFGVQPGLSAYAQLISAPAVSGTVTSVQVRVVFGGQTRNARVKVWADSFGTPGSALFTSGNFSISSDQTINITGLGLSIAAGNKFWIGLEFDGSAGGGPLLDYATNAFSGDSTKTLVGGNWVNATSGIFLSGGLLRSNRVSYTFSQQAVPKSGQWISNIYDSNSIYIIANLFITHSGTYPSGGSFTSGPYTTGSVTQLEGSNQADFSGGPEVFASFNNVNGLATYNLSAKRYWRIRITLNTSDNRVTPTVGLPVLTFTITGEWVSPAIDATADVVSYDTLDIADIIPSGTSIVYTVATSNDDITYPDGFVNFASAVVRRYIKIKASLQTTADNVTSPTIGSIKLNWTTTSTFESATIDTTATPPAGWSIFQASDVSGGGTIAYYMRSASSLVALASATYYLVTPEQLPPPTVVPLQYTQWKAIITSQENEVPVINSVTIRWLLNSNQSLRAASIFVDRRYFVAVATIGSSTNNTVFELDVNNKWRVHDGLEIATMAYFFNEPYYGSSNVGKMFKFLEGFLDDETENIEIDIRTKAFDFSDRYADTSSKFKTIQEVVLNGVGTGADYTIQYSVDNGINFITIPHDSGASSFQSLNNGMRFSERFRVNFAYGNVVSGRTIMIRITTNDEFDIEIHSLKIRAWIRNQE